MLCILATNESIQPGVVWVICLFPGQVGSCSSPGMSTCTGSLLGLQGPELCLNHRDKDSKINIFHLPVTGYHSNKYVSLAIPNTSSDSTGRG